MRRVVVTGIGMCSPLGFGADFCWEKLISAKSGIDTLKGFENKHNVVLYDMKNDSYDDLKAFLNNRSIDLVFNLVHGEGGEDGKIQNYSKRCCFNS